MLSAEIGSVSTSVSTSSNSAALGQNSVLYVPITITNTQNSPTPASFQQMLTIDSAAYSNDINSAWSNVEFTTGPGATGTPLQAWIESGAGNTVSSTIVWVNLPSGIGANSNTVIYMNFMQSNVMSSSGPTGEAPQLSSTYGQYDNGASVFNFYDNFAGTSLNTNKWTQGAVTGTFSVNNGAELTGSDPSMWLYGKIAVSTSIFEVYMPSSVSGSWQIRSGWSLTQGDATNYDVLGAINGWSLESALDSLLISPGTQQYTSGGYIQTLIWSATGSEQAYENYANELSGTNTLYTRASTSYPSIWLVYSNPGTATDVVQWARTRAYPPNGVMPSASFGSVV